MLVTSSGQNNLETASTSGSPRTNPPLTTIFLFEYFLLDIFSSRAISITAAIIYNFLVYKRFVFRSNSKRHIEKLKY